MTKREAERCVREIWAERQAAAARAREGARLPPMDEFVASFARTKFGSDAPLVADWTYNLVPIPPPVAPARPRTVPTPPPPRAFRCRRSSETDTTSTAMSFSRPPPPRALLHSDA